MNLNLHILKEELAPCCTEGHMTDAPSDLSCTHPLLYVKGMDFFSGPVYIARAEDLPDPPTSLPLNLICIGDPPKDYLQDPFNVLVADKGDSELEMLTSVLMVFGRYDEWQRSMERVVDDGRTAKELGEVAAAFLDNPVNLWTSGLRDVFYISSVIDEEDNVLQGRLGDLKKSLMRFRADRHLPAEDLLAFASDPEFCAISESAAPVLYEGKGRDFPCRALIYALGAPDEVVAYLIVDEVNHVVSAKDIALATIVGTYMKRLLSASSPSVRGASTLAELLESLITRSPIRRGQLSEALSEARWNVHDECRVFVVDASGSPSPHASLRALDAFVAETFEFILPVSHGNRLVLVANESRAAFGEGSAKAVAGFAQSVGAAGMSESFSDLRDIRSFYEQACAALELEGGGERGEGVLQYSDCYVQDMLMRCKGDRAKASLVPANLRSLERYDEENGTSLVALLALYLNNNLNVSQTARAAYLHRNTCMNKLSRISDLLSVDFGDPDAVLGLQIAIRILNS